MFAKVLIFTDLDGSLLDHFSYSFEAAKPLLTLFREEGVPVIPVTSKTRAELMLLRSDLDNRHPFIVENGAAIFIPQGYFPFNPPGCESLDGYDCYAFSKPRDFWLGVLSEVSEAFVGEFDTFTSLGIDGIVQLTGLSEERAQLANRREYSEPVMWRGPDARKSIFVIYFLRAIFVQRLRQAGATVLQGGRFLHVTGGCNKGQAFQWLCDQYVKHWADPSVLTIAAGDSYNDIDMLHVADCALVIRSPAHDFPEINHPNVYYTTQYGPVGWAEGVCRFLGVNDDSADVIDDLRNKLRG